MKKKRVLFINGHLNSGGVERSLIDLLGHFDYSEYSVDLMLFEDLGDYYDELPEKVNVIYKNITCTYCSSLKAVLNCIFKRNVFALKYMFYRISGKRKYLKSAISFLPAYDIVVSYRTGFCHDVLTVTNALKKIVWWHHGDTKLSEQNAKKFIRNMEVTDSLVCVSDGIKDEISDKFPAVADKCVVIPNMLDRKGLEKKSLSDSNSYIKQGYINLLSIGRFSPEKNYIICPDICKVLVGRGYKVNWIIVGDGTERKLVEERAKSLGVYESFVFAGIKANPYIYMKGTDVFVHPSLVESQSITILEAMACGVPVVAVKSLGPSEFMKDGENGFMCDNNAVVLADKIEVLFTDKNLAGRMAENAYTVTDNYSPEKIMSKIYKLMEAQ